MGFNSGFKGLIRRQDSNKHVFLSNILELPVGKPSCISEFTFGKPGPFKKQYNHLKEGIKYYLIIYAQMGNIICASQNINPSCIRSEDRVRSTALFERCS